MLLFYICVITLSLKKRKGKGMVFAFSRGLPGVLSIEVSSNYGVSCLPVDVARSSPLFRWKSPVFGRIHWQLIILVDAYLSTRERNRFLAFGSSDVQRIRREVIVALAEDKSNQVFVLPST
jgi:hypothetical protein